MDRNLPGNHRFRLNEDAASNHDGKLHIFVKLTDSCMKAIETYMKQNKKQNLSNIKFNLNGGEISIPINNNERKTYSFQISPENKTPEVFQCIKQINRDQLESCGLIEQRINIHAQEDVYSMTKTKVTEFQKTEELTKKQTKEIGESSKTILEKKHKSSNQRTSMPTLNKTKQRTVTNQEERLSPTTNTQSSPSERPLRERLIHLLAARTYKKPDLLARLKSEGGMRDDEKEQLDTLLSSISTQSKSGEYFLLKSILTSGEVNYDWPFYPKGEASMVRKKIKEQQANAARPTINKTTNDIPSVSSNANRLSLPIQNSSSKGQISNATSTTTTTVKANSSLISTLNRSGINEERNQLDNEETTTTTSTQNPLSDERMQQLSDMLDKLNNAISQTEKPNELLTNEMDLIDEDDIDEAEKEYTRLVPEYNGLIDYLKNVSERFISLQQQFNDEQNSEKASKIVDEFFKCENNEGFLTKRQRVIELHMKLNHLQKILQRNSPSNTFDISEDDDNLI
ncbi:unnamed protein product [Adineta steineri]|uniref:OCEL domain-containing protein n=1 Tax=Adineta steineri TaxID=433720 RepID=A0A819B5G3_9BILA|nr:unnamed protein product [Adineta steineri]CAF1245393.1 unnamed protein product [Adineta steineri]CAF1391932.1 unnamed protein product [Adineta steineri]CAF3502829.1 unnamed protein product [Adineta steineri]CAF3688200.1 unnamed protein product [Adineta steineri]